MSISSAREKASFALRGHNPDVLSCIASLSSDEVFTPPELAEQMLDSLAEAWAAEHGGASIWSDPNVTFLDPFAKSGVFLREITRRLTAGLSERLPDLQERVDHILTKQVYGIGITRLTSLLARRTLYCSKDADGEHSIAKSFDRDWGNVWFERTEHTWAGDKCAYCAASKSEYDRAGDLETHAYAFIHTTNPRALLAKMFGADVQFDVIIGNPPYQLDDGGAGKSAAPIYQLFINAGKDLSPRFMTMVTPSRWMAGGKGLDEFRAAMLADDRLRVITDFVDSDEAFPGVDIAGGVSYFLWSRDSRGPCAVTTIVRGRRTGPVERRLDQFDVFVRHSSAVSVLEKVWPSGPDFAKSLGSRVSGRKAFGFATTDRGAISPQDIDDPLLLLSSGGTGYVSRKSVTTNRQWIDMWKATVSRAAPAGGRPDKDGRYYGLSSIRVVPAGTVTTEAYPVVGAYDTERDAEHMCTYLRTRFVRFLLTLRAANQSVTRSTFGFVPDLPMDRPWTDAGLYEKYGITDEEIAFIESMVRPMEPTDA